MSGQEYGDLPRKLKLVEGVRLAGDDLVFRARILRGQVPIATEEVLIPVDDASVIHAQLSRFLNEYSFPGMEERKQRREKARRGW